MSTIDLLWHSGILPVALFFGPIFAIGGIIRAAQKLRAH